jgi:hypothetical protein
MATKTKPRERRVSLSVAVPLTAELATRVIASESDWDEQDKTFLAPIWAGTRTAASRFIGQAICKHGARYYESNEWRDQRTKEENAAAIRVARRAVKRLFYEL